MNSILLSHDALDVSSISSEVNDVSCGATSIFIGTTRDNFDGKKVISLEYEAYEPMAIKVIEAICEEVRCRWNDIVNIAIHHRLGLVPVKMASVVIAMSSPHRESALNAVTFAIEELKRRVPIWKKEKYNDDESAWKENKECQWINADAPQLLKKPTQKTYSCKLETFDQSHTNLIQIMVGEQEMQRRMQCFMQNKRKEIDLQNILDFTLTKNEIETDMSACARTTSNATKQESSKGLLKVRRYENSVGPQTKKNYSSELDKLMSDQPKIKLEKARASTLTRQDISKLSCQQERINNIMQYIGLPAHDDRTIFDILKDIENRILNLESISPEYKHFLTEAADLSSSVDTRSGWKRRTYSADELENIIAKNELITKI